MFRASILLFLTQILTCQSFQPVQPWEITDMGDAEQALFVTANTDTSTTAILQRYDKTPEGWTKTGESFPVVLGRTGLAWGQGLHGVMPGQQKEEGDGKSPAGIYPLRVIFGSAPSDSAQFRLPYLHISEVVECIDDTNSKFYNQLVNNSFVEKDWNSSEHMLSIGHPYKWGVLVGHNPENKVPGGSCIFLHIWKSPMTPTAGCTAMSEKDILTVIEWLDEAKRPVLVQGVHPVFNLKY